MVYFNRLLVNIEADRLLLLLKVVMRGALGSMILLVRRFVKREEPRWLVASCLPNPFSRRRTQSLMPALFTSTSMCGTNALMASTAFQMLSGKPRYNFTVLMDILEAS